MSSATSTKIAAASVVDASTLARIAQEGYGPGAWHGADLKAALEDVTPELAYWRPKPGRHNIAEIAVHHAYTARSVRERLTGKAAEPFVLKGEDWFDLANESTLAWSEILELVTTQQRKLDTAIADLGNGRAQPAEDVKPFDVVLGITCHAVYHAGQIQLIKRLRAK
jgi:hypothetical protein